MPTAWVSKADFLAGYGAAQAVPGPLFTFAGYLGAMLGGVVGALVALAAILFAMLTFWELPPWVVVLTGALGGSLM